jgi:hypothetical protein
MTCRRFLQIRFSIIAVALFLVALSSATLAQGPEVSVPLPDAPSSSAPAEPAPLPFIAPVKLGVEHKFLDRTNIALFAISASLNTADFVVTHANLQSGGKELNPIVRIFGRSGPGLSVNFIGETVGVIGVSYFLHKTGHHRLERMVPLVNIACSAGAVTYGLTHQTSVISASSDAYPAHKSVSFNIPIKLSR